MKAPALLRIAAVAAALALATASPVRADALGWSLTPLAGRTSDEVIARDLDLIAAWRARLDALPGAASDPWRATSARAWLDLAREEYTDNDETGFVDAAFDHARALIRAIEAGEPPIDPTNPPRVELPRGAMRVRGDLWQVLERLRLDPGFPCAMEALVNLEIQLAWAGNEVIDQGACFALPHVQEAERLAHQATLAADACGKAPEAPEPRAPETVAPPAPGTEVAVPPIEMPTQEELRIPRDVHFAVSRATLSTRSREIIGGVCDLMKKYPSIRVRLEGHTDSRGDPDYNLRLSLERVNAVRDLMLRLGIAGERIRTINLGELEPTAEESDKRGLALNRRVEMVFEDPEGRTIETERQEGDLQIER